MNKVILLGNICQDIEIRMTESGKSLLSNSIAVRKDYKNQETGEYDSEFINFTAWGNTAEYLRNYAKKGSRILIEGRLTTYRKENEETGEVRIIVKVIADRVQIINSRKETTETAPEEEQPEEYNDPFLDDTVELTDEDLPWN